MSRYRHLTGSLLTFVMGAFPIAAHAGGKSNATYDGELAFGSQLLYLDDGCLSVNGSVTSGKFFDDLRRTNVGGHFEYRKRGNVVTKYPESLTTSIRLVGDKCAAELSNAPSAVFTGDSFSVKLAVEWKEGMELRPATLSPVIAHCIGATSVAVPRQDFTIPSVTCQLTIDSKGVPLADHLIVSVFGADGARLTRLSAAP